MKNKLASLLAMLALVLIISSCGSDTTTTDPASTDMFPNTIGNYWVNEDYDLDTLGNIDAKSMSFDSTIVSGSMQLNGKLATELSSFTIGTKDTAQKTYLAKGTNNLYISADMINGVVGMFAAFISVDPTKMYLDEKWLLIADQSQSTWNVATKNFSNIPFTYNGTINGVMSGNTIVTGKKGTTLNVTIQGKSYTAQEYIMESNLTSNLTITIPAGTIKIKNTQHFWIAPGVGLVKQMVETTLVNLDITLAQIKQTQKFPGYQSTCVRFKLK